METMGNIAVAIVVCEKAGAAGTLRCAARAGSGMLAAVNAHAVKESQTDLRFMVLLIMI